MLIRKFIIRSGKTPIGYEGATVDFAPERLHGWADKANRMIRSFGFDIPAPPTHDERAVPHKAGVLLSGEDNGFENLGFWKRFEAVEELDDEGERYTALYGVIDAPGDENDVNSPAGKLLKRIKKVSIRTYDRFVDPLKKVWEDVIVHVAPCIHPALQDQKPFEKIEGDHPGLAFSVALAATASSEVLKDGDLDNDGKEDETEEEDSEELDDAALSAEVSRKLKFANVFVKPNESCRKFLETLNIALDQMVGDDGSDMNGTDNADPDSDKNLISRKGIAMNVAADKTVEKNEPVTTSQATTAVADAPAFDAAKLESGILLSVARQSLAPQIKSNCQRRLDTLKAAGIDEALAKELQGYIDGVSGVKLSVTRNPETEEVSHEPTVAETALDIVEKTMKGVILSSSQANGARGQDGSVANPHRNTGLTEEQFEKELEEYFAVPKVD